MRDELYINGMKADMGSSDISLKYNSNLLTDISKIVSNTSYTIKLPKTKNNLRLIECAHVPSAVTRFPYISHAAKLIRDGVEVVSNANVILLSVNEYIEIALSWGLVNNFEPVVDRNLNEMRYSTDDYVIWAKGENSRMFPQIDYGFKNEDAKVWYHPAVSVKWIMDRISNNAGITFSLPYDRMQDLNEMFIPITDTKDSDVLANANIIKLTPYKIVQTDFFKLLCFNTLLSGDFYCKMIDDNTLKCNSHKATIQITGSINFEVEVNGKNGEPNSGSIPVKLEIRNKKSNGTPVLATILGDVEHIAGKRYRYSFSFIDCSFEMDPDYEVSIVLHDIYTIGVDVYDISVVIGEAGSLQIRGKYEEIILGDRYYLVPNLPDIKQIDFLKAISNMLGLFAIPSEDGSIRFISFDTLESNKHTAIDWSDYIIHKSDDLPLNIEYALPDMARVNRFKYKEEKKEKDTVNDEGSIIIDNLTLEYERISVELPFAATKMINTIARIQMYEYDGENLKVESSVTPRILRYKGNTGVFTELSWGNLLNKYYSSYKKLVSEAKVISERVRLNAVQLKNLDMTVPVYISQYGGYFAIITVITKQDDICEVKLLKM